MVVWRNDVRHIHSFQWLQFGNSTKNTHFRSEVIRNLSLSYQIFIF